MKVRKFFGSTSREALREVRRDLGEDAIILANRSVDGGTEITAVTPEVLHAASREHAAPVAPAAAAPLMASEPAKWADGVRSEIRELRSVLEDRLGGLVWGDMARREPLRARLFRSLLNCGFSPGIASQVAQKVPPESGAEQALVWARRALGRNLRCASEDAIMARGGVYALMGPTGVGKTTTAAKLAARCVVRHGAEKLALLTTDTYRVGAHEQLRIFGRILGVAVHAICDAEDLRTALAELRGKHMVLIDTIGTSQRDRMVAEQLEMMACAGLQVNRLLLLGACSAPDTLDEVVRAHRANGELAGVILTKIDEAVSLGGALDVILRHRLELFYVANGQQVPEDLHAANRDYLMHRALRERGQESAYRLEDAEMPALVGVTRGWATPGAAVQA